MKAHRIRMIGLGLLLGSAAAVSSSAVASTPQAASVKWFEAHFTGSEVQGYVAGTIQKDGRVQACAILEDARTGRTDAGCGAVPLYVDPALRYAAIRGELASEVFDTKTGRSLGASTIKIDVWSYTTGLPIVTAGHHAFAGGVDPAGVNGSSGVIDVGASGALVRPAGAYGSMVSTKVCSPRKPSRRVWHPVPCVRGISDTVSDGAWLGQELATSLN